MGESQGTLVGVAAFFSALVVVTLYMSNAAQADFEVGYYATTCPKAESIITKSMKASIAADSTVAPAFCVSHSMIASFVYVSSTFPPYSLTLPLTTKAFTMALNNTD
jgi:hypothetical protein